MRRRDDLRQRRQPFVSGWLGLEHVQAGAGDVSRLDRIRERRLVDQLAARRVHNSHTLLAAREPLGVHDVMRLRQRRHMESDEVSA